MKLKVLSKISDDLWLCSDVCDERHRVNLVGCGTPDAAAIRAAAPPFDVEVDWLFPYIELCNECKLIRKEGA